MRPLYNSLMAPPLEVMRRYPPYARPVPIAPELLDRWLAALRLTVVWIDAYRFDRKWRVGPRVCADHFFLYVVRGSARAVVEGHLHRIGPGGLLYVPAGSPHEIVNTTAGTLETRTLHCLAAVYGCVDFPRLVGLPRLLQTRTDRELAGILDRAVRSQYLRPPGWRDEVRGRVFQLFLHLLRRYGDRCAPLLPGRLDERAADLERLNPVFDAIDRRLGAGLRVRDLAGLVHVSASHLRMIFRRATGENLVRFLRRHRVERACALLTSTPLGIKAVADRAGFPNAYYFYRVFKRQIGMTPQQYRAQRPV